MDDRQDRPAWQSDLTINEAVMYMWKAKIGCDVSFEVGESKTLIPCHRFILEARSFVFYRLLNGPMSEKNITINDQGLDTDNFTIFLKYLYSDNINDEINGDNVIALLYLARKYDVQGLEKECSKFLKEENSFSPDSACFIFEQGFIFDMQTIMNDSMAVIRQSAKKCLESEGFGMLSKECVLKIISDDGLQIEEADLYRYVLQWADDECERQMLDLPINDSSRRQVLGDLLYQIRFPTMPLDDFQRKLAKSSLLDQSEKSSIISVLKGRPGKDTKFNSTPRRLCYPILRLLDPEEDIEVDNDVKHAIMFSVSRDALLHGILSYGPTDAKDYAHGLFRVFVEIETQNNKICHEEEISKTADGTSKEYELLFKTSIAVGSRHRLHDMVQVCRRRRLVLERHFRYGGGHT
ncbi:hypothetical protein FSP39_014667 [Pinctada imbricata]|uniref:BTB domain-containing protein n=1 Tax=Pinctada imbricata TaxID=66713 RepID=A0AA89BKQ5_PINIB|nr:hypothetical protein FSP39_014667 [Pinctada imbricata]